MRAVPWFLAAYLLGAIPTSYLVVRLATGRDLRTLGSRNLGATNLYRVLGWRYALPVALFDAAKGAIPVVLFAPRLGAEPLLALSLGITAVVGHMFSIFVGFRGGKGVATGAGVALALAPGALLAAFALWVGVVAATGYVSLASILAALLLPAAVYGLHPDRRSLVWVFALLAVAVVALHRGNIARLLAGTEPRFGRRFRTDGGGTPG